MAFLRACHIAQSVTNTLVNSVCDKLSIKEKIQHLASGSWLLSGTSTRSGSSKAHTHHAILQCWRGCIDESGDPHRPREETIAMFRCCSKPAIGSDCWANLHSFFLVLRAHLPSRDCPSLFLLFQNLMNQAAPQATLHGVALSQPTCGRHFGP